MRQFDGVFRRSMRPRQSNLCTADPESGHAAWNLAGNSGRAPRNPNRRSARASWAQQPIEFDPKSRPADYIDLEGRSAVDDREPARRPKGSDGTLNDHEKHSKWTLLPRSEVTPDRKSTRLNSS